MVNIKTKNESIRTYNYFVRVRSNKPKTKVQVDESFKMNHGV